MKKIRAFFRESYDELSNKVSWPSWSDLQNSATVVSIASLIIALIVYLMDMTFSTILREFYDMFM